MDFEQTTAPAASSEVVQDVHTALFTSDKEKAVLKRMTELYEHSGMSIPALSRVTGIGESTVVRYVTGRTKNPHMFTMVTLIEAMGGNLYDILGLVPPNDPVAVSAPVGNPYGELIDSYREETNTLRSAVDILTRNLDALTNKISGMSKIVAIRTFALLIVIGVFCVLEIVDLSNPDWGRYQWVTELFGQFLHKV